MIRWNRLAFTSAGVFAAMLAIGGLMGCGGGGGAKMAKADAVVVTYYYLPL